MAVTPKGQPVSILFMNGTGDPINPWQGGDVVLWPVLGNRGPVLSAQAWRLLGHSNRDIHAANEIWEFFQSDGVALPLKAGQ